MKIFGLIFPSMSAENEVIRTLTQLTPRTIDGELLLPVLDSLQPLRPVHLGQLPRTRGGWSGGFKDQDEIKVPDTGVRFIVNQTSYGSTGVSAAAEEGYNVEALTYDEESGQTKWQSPQKMGERVNVAWDRGNLQFMSADSPNFGRADLLSNPGIRAGLVRVTELTTGGIKYFGLGARFSGRANDWWVERGVIEFTKVENLPAPTQLLP